MLRTMTLAEAARAVDGTLLPADSGDCAFAGAAIDSRKLEANQLFIALPGERVDGHEFVAAAKAKGAAAALVARHVPVDLPQIVVADVRRALGQLAKTWRQGWSGPLIALTGSNGKTTTKEMLAGIGRAAGRAVLATEGNLNNDLGVPLTLLRLQPTHDFAVIEMGANHRGEISQLTALAQPHVALITNAGPAHLEGFGGLWGVAQGKGEIYQGLRADGHAIINADDHYADYWRGLNDGRAISTFGLDQPATVTGAFNDENQQLTLRYGEQIATVTLPIAGRHNARNALAAVAATLAAGLDWAAMGAGLAAFSPASGRLTPRAGQGCRLIDDAYNANPASMVAGLTVLMGEPAPRWAVLADMGELGDAAAAGHQEVVQAAQRLGVERLYVIGDHMKRATEWVPNYAIHVADIDHLIARLRTDLATELTPPTLLIKGSRFMAMERVVNAFIHPAGDAS